MPTEIKPAQPASLTGSEPSPPQHPEDDALPPRRGHRRWRDSLTKLFELIRDTRPPLEQQALRLRTVEQNIVLPVKALLVIIVASFVWTTIMSVTPMAMSWEATIK